MTETVSGTTRWDALEQWSPRLFLFGSVFILLFALNNGVAFLMDGFSVVNWLYPTVLFGRAAVLLGIAGLSVQVVDQTSRVGKLSRIVLSVTLFFTIGLLTSSILQIIGVTNPIAALFGLGTVVLTVITYALFGAVIIRTGAYSTSIGCLLLVASVTVLGLFIGLTAFPTRLIGAIGEGVIFVTFLSVWRFLRAESTPTDRTEPAPTEVRHD